MSYQGKGTERREEAGKDGGKKGSVPHKGRSTARMEEKLEERAKKEGQVVLWTNSITRYGVVGVGMG